MLTKSDIDRELEQAPRAIDFNSPEWHAIERWLVAKRWHIAELMLTSTSELNSSHNRGRAQMIDELLRLREQSKRPSSD